MFGSILCVCVGFDYAYTRLSHVGPDRTNTACDHGGLHLEPSVMLSLEYSMSLGLSYV